MMRMRMPMREKKKKLLFHNTEWSRSVVMMMRRMRMRQYCLGCVDNEKVFTNVTKRRSLDPLHHLPTMPISVGPCWHNNNSSLQRTMTLPSAPSTSSSSSSSKSDGYTLYSVLERQIVYLIVSNYRPPHTHILTCVIITSVMTNRVFLLLSFSLTGSQLLEEPELIFLTS